jgi:hypothetical protein
MPHMINGGCSSGCATRFPLQVVARQRAAICYGCHSEIAFSPERVHQAVNLLADMVWISESDWRP